MNVKALAIALAASGMLAGTAYANSTITIGITQNNVGVDSYQTTYEKAFKQAAAKDKDVKTIILDAGGDVARQIAQMQDLIQQKVNVIIIWPTNGQAVVPVVRQAYKAGIPVVVTNSNIAKEGQKYIVSFSGPNNIMQGQEAAEEMCTALKARGEPDGKIVQISGQPGYTTAIQRAQGFEQELPKVCPHVKLLETQPADWNREKAQRVMENFLTKYSQIDGVYAGDDNMGVGALNAAEAAGRAKNIVFVGATCFAVGYDAIAKGEYYGSVYQSPVEDARHALETAIKVAHHETVPKLNYFPTPKITIHNYKDFTRPVF